MKLWQIYTTLTHVHIYRKAVKTSGMGTNLRRIQGVEEDDPKIPGKEIWGK